MFKPLLLSTLLLAALAEQDGIDGNSSNGWRERRRNSVTDPPSRNVILQHAKPALEVLMHLPPAFGNLESFISYFRNIGKIPKKAFDKEFAPSPRRKREAESPDADKETKRLIPSEETALVDNGKFDSSAQSSLALSEMYMPLLDVQGELQRSLGYDPYELGRPRSAQPVNDDEDRAQRDKRTFMDNSGSETTTSMPYWKRKKENPPFVTGRESGTAQKSEDYPPAQHRSNDNARESHSIKDLEKTVLSNEITRSNQQDNYFASTNRRTYNNRRVEDHTPRTPKSVYDTIDYANRRRNNPDGRNYRNYDSSGKRHASPEKSVPPEQFARQYTFPRPYDRPYYPLQGDVIGRGIEYYHRTFDPASGRIIYYANMPDPSRHYESTFDPTGRSIYVNGRTYLYDPHGRSFVPPNDYRFSSGYGRAFDYFRDGTRNMDFYYNGSDKRNARYNDARDKGDRSKDDYRNRTYIIFDADETATQDRRILPYIPQDFNRFAYPVPPFSLPYGPTMIPGPPVPYPSYPYRNQYYPTVQTPVAWGTSQKPFLGVTPTNYVTRPFNVPEVQIPLSTRNRGLHPLPEMKKT